MVKLQFNPKQQSSENVVSSKTTKRKLLNLNPFIDSNLIVNELKNNKIHDYIGLENCHYTLKQWYFSEEKANLKENKKPFLIIGPTGCGKTSLIELFCEENDISIYSVKISDKTKKDILKEIQLFSQYSANFFIKSVSKKIIFIDEYQNGQNDVFSITDISELITKTDLPIIIISSDSKGSKLSELKKLCDVYYIAEINFGVIKTWISSKFKDIPENDLLKLIKKCKSDIRLLLNTLHFSKNKVLDNCYKDFDINIYDFTQSLFNDIEPITLNDIFKIYQTDGFLISNLVHENYLDFNNDIDAIAKSAESISLGDYIFSDTYDSTRSFLPDFHCLNALAIPSYCSKSDNKVQLRTSCINNRYNIYLNNKKIVNKINLNIFDIFIIKKILNHDLVKTKVLSEYQKDYLKNVSSIGIENLELIYKHFSDFKENSKPKNFTLKFKEKIKLIINGT
jgi:DNA polymerase III delta prime subunit